MTLLHATWLPTKDAQANLQYPALLIWADTWRAAKPTSIGVKPNIHPFSLSKEDLKNYLLKKNLLPKEYIDTTAYLTLPSKEISKKQSTPISTTASKNKLRAPQWTGLPLQAGEPIPKQYEWWPWEVEGLSIMPNQA